MKLKIKNRFGIIPNELLSNENISWKAKGLYGYLQSKPDDWDFSADRISKEAKDGLDSTKSGLQELEKAGYLERKKFKNEKGQWGVEYMLYDTPFDGKTRVENPLWEEGKNEKTVVENPSTENSPTNKKRINNNIILSKDNIIEQAQDFSSYNISENEKIENSEDELKKENLEEESEKSSAEPEIFGNEEINNILAFLKKIIGVSDFKESQKMQRIHGKNILSLGKKIGKEDFQFRLKNILDDGFKAKNCNSLGFLYKELKAFIHSPVVEKITTKQNFKTGFVVSDNF